MAKKDLVGTLADETMLLHPELKFVMRFLNKYVPAFMSQWAWSYMHMSEEEIEAREMDFCISRLYNSGGHIKQGKGAKPMPVHALMMGNVRTQLCIITYKGNNIKHRVSRVVFNPRYKKLMLDYMWDMVYDITPTLPIKELDDLVTNTKTLANKASLEAYIGRLRHESPHGKALLRKALLRKALWATKILARIKTDDDGNEYVDECYKTIDGGRLQGYGLSLVPNYTTIPIK
jgi:hypothetical protein